MTRILRDAVVILIAVWLFLVATLTGLGGTPL